MRPLPGQESMETTLLRQLVRLHGRDPSSFQAVVLQDGSICVRCRGTAAFYRPQAWTSRFVHHLCKGYFDQALKAVPA